MRFSLPSVRLAPKNSGLSFKKLTHLFPRPVSVDSRISSPAPQGGNNLEPSLQVEETPRKPEAR